MSDILDGLPAEPQEWNEEDVTLTESSIPAKVFYVR